MKTENIESNKVLITCAFTPKDVSESWFSAELWQQKNAITGTSKGRGITYFFEHGEKEYVLRHYCRGGLIGKFNYDRYRFDTLERTRPHTELMLLEQLVSKSLPVPNPVAGLITRSRNFYRADLIIEKIPQAQDAFHYLTEQPLTALQWQMIGKTIAQFHHHSVYHADLNIHNILIERDEKIWIIDFDKGQLKPHSEAWKQQNLTRLRRSLNKEKTKNPNFFWQSDDWESLLFGYAQFSAIKD